MTITTSKQLAEVLGPKWVASSRPEAMSAQLAHPSGGPACIWAGLTSYGWCRILTPSGGEACDADPRAAVLALADRLEAEARALRESVKEGP